MLITHLLQPAKSVLCKEHIVSFVQSCDAAKSLGAKVRVRVAVSILAKANFQKAFVSHCMEFLAVFHSQCLSAGTRLESEQEKQEYNLWDGAETQKMLLFVRRETDDANT